MSGRIFQLNLSKGGVPKQAVRVAMVTDLGLEGDVQAHPTIHGGPDRALCLFSLERILEFQSEGHPIYPGSIGENVTVTGLDWSTIVPGTRLALGDEVLVEVTKYTSPCNSMEPSFSDGNFSRLSQKMNAGYSRVYARVLQTGKIIVGQAVRVDGEFGA